MAYVCHKHRLWDCNEVYHISFRQAWNVVRGLWWSWLFSQFPRWRRCEGLFGVAYGALAYDRASSCLVVQSDQTKQREPSMLGNSHCFESRLLMWESLLLMLDEFRWDRLHSGNLVSSNAACSACYKLLSEVGGQISFSVHMPSPPAPVLVSWRQTCWPGQRFALWTIKLLHAMPWKSSWSTMGCVVMCMSVELRRSMALILERAIAQLFSIGSHRWKRSTVHLFLNTFCTLLPVSTFSARTPSGWLCQWFGGWCGKDAVKYLWKLYGDFMMARKIWGTNAIIQPADFEQRRPIRQGPKTGGFGHAGLVVLIEGLMQWNGWKHHNMKGDDASRCDAVLLEGLGGLESASERSGEAQEHPSTWSTAYLDRIAQVPLAASTLGSSCFFHPEKDVAILVYCVLHLSSCPRRSLTSFSEFVEKALFFCRADSSCGCSSANSRMYWSVWNEVVYPIALPCSACIRQGNATVPLIFSFCLTTKHSCSGCRIFRQPETLFRPLRSSLPIQNRKFLELWAPSRRRSRCHCIRSRHSQAVEGRKS